MSAKRNALTIAIILLIIAGSTLQVLNWDTSERGDWGIFEIIIVAVLALSAIFFPQQFRRAAGRRRVGSKFDLLLGMAVVAGLLILLSVVYVRYYEPTVRAMHSSGSI
jgi:hypothetical protein